MTDNTTKALVEALEFGLNSFAERLAEREGSPELAKELIRRADPKLPFGRMRDALAAYYSQQAQSQQEMVPPDNLAIANALEEYWDAAWQEGREDRHHDTEDGRAAKALAAVYSAIYAAPKAAQPTVAVPDGWLPIETAPKDGTKFLAWWAHPTKDAMGVITTSWLDNSKTAHPWAGWSVPSMTMIIPGSRPTHWQALPAAPGKATP